ncbi:TlpA family protein disulfide reductase [Rasiella sp. SM2506]|uniref:TlpA family protein disulfide reductase n=1 Tax=Rasiella sp. SM2506 TaxID=3423914 RepID=UPI003D7B5D6D
MITFFKKNWSTIILLVLVALLFIPQTGTPIKVFFNRLIAFSPSEIAEEEQEILSDYSWQLQDLEGTTIDFTSAEKKVTLVNVWATWCPPCLAEMPSMQALYDRYHTEVSFYFVSLEDTEILQRFIDKKEYSFPVYTTQDNFPKLLETNSFPTTYLISKSGKISINKKGAADWDSESVRETIDALLAE